MSKKEYVNCDDCGKGLVMAERIIGSVLICHCEQCFAQLRTDLAMTKKLHEHAVAEVHSGVEIIKQLKADLAAAAEKCKECKAITWHKLVDDDYKGIKAENKLLKKDIELRKDYESYLQSTAGPMYSYNSWKKQQAQKGDTE